MANRRGRSSQVIGELADLTGRSEAEIKVMLGAAVATVAAGVAIRAVKILVDFAPPPLGC
jgi:cell division inhibitor SulA